MPMGLKYVDPSGKEMFLNPHKDMAYIWPEVLDKAVVELQEQNWPPWLASYLKQHNITEQVLMETLLSIYHFFNDAKSPGLHNPGHAIDSCQFTEFPAAAQIAVLAKLGQVAAVLFWTSIRATAMLEHEQLDIPNIKANIAEITAHIDNKLNSLEKDNKVQA